MKLTTEQLQMLETMGGTFFSVKECAIVLEVPEAELKRAISDNTSPAHKSYYKGKLKQEIALRESIIKMATRGSNPAQKMLLEILTNTNTANL